MESRTCCLKFEFTSHILKHLKLNSFRNGETCQDYLKLWNVIDWVTIAFGFTTVSFGKQDSFESWRPAPQPCDQEPHFLDFCGQLRQFCSQGSKWFRFKGIGEFRQQRIAVTLVAILMFAISSSTNYWIRSPKLFQVLFFTQNCPSLRYQKRQVFLDGFCAEGEWGVASNSRRAPIRCFGFCCFDQSVIPHCRGSQRDFDVWLGWPVTNLVRTCKNILWACVFLWVRLLLFFWIFARSLMVWLIALSLDWTV